MRYLLILAVTECCREGGGEAGEASELGAARHGSAEGIGVCNVFEKNNEER